ncbi:protein hook [Cydia pomonella]|uniref:protein hook n=1 Tax=Cydia pomonella TaxID=82600 RepID=UPI002ADDF7A8|nr:protein hook [Cydia pomonella]
MEQPNSIVLCDNLIKWLQTLNLKAKHGNPSELSDGVAIAEALTQVAPEYFSPSWNSKIKTDVGHNWRLKVSNLKKILEGVFDYHQDILNLSLQDFSRPDVVNIAEHADPSDLGRLLQLVLSCAVNCDKKEEYITRIMELELSCQRSIMQAIQELETLTLGGRGAPPADAPEPDTDMREVLAQRCHELDTQVKILQEEKMTLLSEVARLTATRQDERPDDDDAELDEAGASLGPAHAGTLRYSNMRAQLDALKDELDKVELQRDDQRARADALERELALMKLRNEELQIAASENVTLKDEVDALRETAAKAATLEATVASYKKRMEEHVDLRRQVKLLERANTEHVQRAIEHEQAATRANALRAKLDIYKKQVIDLNEKLDAEMTKADKLEIENKKLSSRADFLQRERDKLACDRDALKETVEDLTHYTITAGASEDNVSQELIPTEMKDKLIRLEHENKLLRQNQGAQADQGSVQALLEDYAARLEKQRALHREQNQRIMQLEAALEAAPAKDPRLATAMEDSQRKSLQVEELQAALAEERRRAAKLQEALAARDAELVATEDKYKRCVEKAKEVIKSLDPRAAALPSLSDMTLGYARGAGAGAARGDATPNNNRHEWSGSGSGGGSSEARGSTEQRLLASAWYQLGARCHRDAVETRFALLSAGHSFLARQRRQPPPPRAAPRAGPPAVP